MFHRFGSRYTRHRVLRVAEKRTHSDELFPIRARVARIQHTPDAIFHLQEKKIVASSWHGSSRLPSAPGLRAAAAGQQDKNRQGREQSSGW
ncbi:MAG: hypothetical protein HY319_02820 [Armatimonadetes bacterium]|nr:hypothetical protein [Armatimonadota bacterium]